jgi:hypothetical protein
MTRAAAAHMPPRAVMAGFVFVILGIAAAAADASQSGLGILDPERSLRVDARQMIVAHSLAQSRRSGAADVIFDIRNLPKNGIAPYHGPVYAQSYDWGTQFMNSHAVWSSENQRSWVGNPEIDSMRRDYIVFFPVTGMYHFQIAVDNRGSFSLDGDILISHDKWDPAAETSISVEKGNHTISVFGENLSGLNNLDGNPAGVAAVITSLTDLNGNITLTAVMDSDACVNETRTMKEIISGGREASGGFFQGGLGGNAHGDWETYGCWRKHACLDALNAAGVDTTGDAICYKFNSAQQSWLLWGLQSSLNLQCSSQTRRARSDHSAVNPQTESPLSVIKEAKGMLDNGVLTQPEFDKIKKMQIAKMG